MQKDQIKREVLKYIKQHEGTTYVELEQVFDRCGFEWQGDLESCAGANDSVVFWSGWNSEAFKIVDDLLRSKKIERDPCPTFIYFIDGKVLNYPTLKGNPYKVKRTHWLPCVFNIMRKSI